MALGNVLATISIPPRWQAGQIYLAHGYYTVGATVAQNDTITFTDIVHKNGVEIISTRLQVPKLDTNATPTGVFILGDSGDDDRFINDVSMGWDDEATYVSYDINVASSTTGAGYAYNPSSSATSLVLKVDSAVATAASTGHIGLWMAYYCKG